MSARRAWLGKTPVRSPTARRGGFKAFHLGSFSNRLGSRAVNIILFRPFAARRARRRRFQPPCTDGTLNGSPLPSHAGQAGPAAETGFWHRLSQDFWAVAAVPP